MKKTLHVVEFERKEIDSNLEFPVYLYYQDELCYDELVMITEMEKITVKRDQSRFKIEVDYNYQIDAWRISGDSITTKKHFDETMKEAMDNINNIINEVD